MAEQIKSYRAVLPVVLFVMLFKVVLTFETVDEILKCGIQMKALATEQYFPVALFVMLYKVVLTFDTVGEILKCDHSNETTEQYFHVVLFIILYNVFLTFESVNEILKCDHSSESYRAVLSSGSKETWYSSFIFNPFL